MIEYGSADQVRELLRERGWPVAGVFVGGCVNRGVGSSFRALAHTHTQTEPHGWICVRSPKRLLTPSGNPSRILLHEVAHVLAPKAGHGSKAFIEALAAVGIRTDSYSRAGRNRAAGIKRPKREVFVHDHLSGESCRAGCLPYDEWLVNRGPR